MAETLAKRREHPRVWVASASIHGIRAVADLIPLSLAWIDECVAVVARSATNGAQHCRAEQGQPCARADTQRRDHRRCDGAPDRSD